MKQHARTLARPTGGAEKGGVSRPPPSGSLARVAFQAKAFAPRAISGRGVVQRRLPDMTAETIAEGPEVAVELLVNRVREMDDDQLLTLFGVQGQLTIEQVRGPLRAQLIERLRTRADQPDWLLEKYQQIDAVLDGGQKYAATEIAPVGPATDPAQELTQQILVALPDILENVSRAYHDVETLTGIFGDQVAAAQAVLGKVYDAINAHHLAGTSPVKVSGGREHKEWIGEGAVAQQGASVVQLGDALVQQLAAGDVKAASILVHEYSHSSAKTEDLAYGIAGCQKLKPAQRVKNATTFEQCFMAANGHPDPRYDYDPEIAKDKSTSTGSTVGQVRKDKARAAAGYASEIWNMHANLHTVGQILLQNPLNDAGRQVLHSGTFPHLPFASPATYVAGMAMLEDRAKLLGQRKSIGKLKPTIMAIPAEDLEGCSSQKILAMAVAEPLGLSEEHASIFIALVEASQALFLQFQSEGAFGQ